MNVLLRLVTLLSGLFGVMATGLGIYSFLTLYKNSVFVSARALLAGVFALLTAFAFAKQVRKRERLNTILSGDTTDASSNASSAEQLADIDESIWPNKVTWIVIGLLIAFVTIYSLLTFGEASTGSSGSWLPHGFSLNGSYLTARS